MTLRVEGLRHRFEGTDTAVLSDVSFIIAPGEITCMLGPSGVGKSTLLHIIAGLVIPDCGSVLLDDIPLDKVPTHRRPFTLLMQQPQLFAHLDIVDNVAFGLRVRGVRRKERRDSARAWLSLVGIAHLERRAVVNLSGGEQQRVALARALAVEPRVLLADEPFASVDTAARHDLQTLLRELQQTLGTTIVLVTHDEREADRLAHRKLTVHRGGRVEDEAPDLAKRVRYELQALVERPSILQGSRGVIAPDISRSAYGNRSGSSALEASIRRADVATPE